MQKKFSIELLTMWLFVIFAAAGLALVNVTYPNSEKGYPTLIFGLMLLFSVICLVQHYRKRARSAEKGSAEDADEEKKGNPGSFNAWFAIIASIAYLLLMDVLGFLIGTFLFSILVPLGLGYRKPLPILATGICCIVFVCFLFTKLYIPIPAGILSFFQ